MIDTSTPGRLSPAERIEHLCRVLRERPGRRDEIEAGRPRKALGERLRLGMAAKAAAERSAVGEGAQV